ncbi:MAG TPA: aldose epimerase family protein, partial [Acidimicrobiia bacterium]|nr:aldose epimerase family protein [Acidimicrobiia bacterium]
MIADETTPAEESPDASRLIELVGPTGLRAELTNHGARLTRLLVPDAGGRTLDVVLGFDTLAEYETNHGLYFGATVGRVANRIAGAGFSIDGVQYTLAANDGANHLHGGASRSFDRVVWNVRRGNPNAASVEFRYSSLHLEEGFPGNVEVTVTYRLTGESGLRIDYEATTDRRTPVNLTHHTYWNLGGGNGERVDDHRLTVFADRFTPTNQDLIPLGPLSPVDRTALDFKNPTAIGPRIAELADSPSIGLDHNLVLSEWDSTLRWAGRLEHPRNGLVMDLHTTEPGVQVYSAGSMPRTVGKDGVVYPPFGGICLEAQHFPDSLHHPEYPSILLGPGETYR